MQRWVAAPRCNHRVGRNTAGWRCSMSTESEILLLHLNAAHSWGEGTALQPESANFAEAADVTGKGAAGLRRLLCGFFASPAVCYV